MNTTGDDELAAFTHQPADLATLLTADHPPFPELAAVQANLTAFREAPRTRAALDDTAPLLRNLDAIPATTYSRRRAFAQTGAREPYETPYYRKREILHAAALHTLLGAGDYRDALHDYLWNICEETSWIAPAHARVIDLMAAETAFGLAEIVALLGPHLDAEVRYRVRDEIERRIFAPFLHSSYDLRWFGGGDNWNGVCAGAIGGAFLYLERDPERLGRALSLTLESLRGYFTAAFAADGSTTEGVGYWHYGLTYPIIFAELLRGRTAGAIDLLAAPRVRPIAAFPAAMLLAPGRFASFADASETVAFNPGPIARLAARTDEASLLGVLAPPTPFQSAASSGFSRTLRDLLWWDGERHAAPPLGDALLPASGIARLAARTTGGVPITLAAKAGHNDENHNHNDIGSFILRVGDETFLADPGPGHYERDYFNERRYDSPFANSLGHSVPRIAGELQGTGLAFSGTLTVEPPDHTGGAKRLTIAFHDAYPVPTLADARRTLALEPTAAEGATLLLHDAFAFSDAGAAIEEALVTRLPVTLAGATATIHGQAHNLLLTIEQPVGATVAIETLPRPGSGDVPPAQFNRLSFTIPAASASEARVRMTVRARTAHHGRKDGGG